VKTGEIFDLDISIHWPWPWDPVLGLDLVA